VSGARTAPPGTEGRPPKLLALGFVAGFLAVALFHQPMLGLLRLVGVTAAAPYATRPVPPLGAPQVVSQSF
jgi:hypothetical protein